MISDLVTNEKLSEKVVKSFDARADFIAGALEREKYLNVIPDAGFSDIQVMKETPYAVEVSKDLIGRIPSNNVEAYKL